MSRIIIQPMPGVQMNGTVPGLSTEHEHNDGPCQRDHRERMRVRTYSLVRTAPPEAALSDIPVDNAHEQGLVARMIESLQR